MSLPPSVSTKETLLDGQQIKVMLVDDSSVIRGALARIIEDDPDIKIAGSLSNGEMAVSAAARTQPDIIILDIEMPVMDGLEALPKILQVSPKSKIIMFSSLTEKGASVSLKAFSLGAVECIVKPTSSQQVGKGSDFQKQLLAIIKGLAPRSKTAPVAPTSAPSSKSTSELSAAPATYAVPKDKAAFSLYDDKFSYKGKPDIIIIGSSTGGPQALFEVLKNFKGLDIPIIITQHMPATFTKILAQHIEQQTGIPAKEGENGMRLQPGHIYVAPGSFHMLITGDKFNPTIKLDDGPPVNFCKPAVDPMFKSAVEIYDKKILAIMLTGMGNDGLGGSKELVKAGARLIAQDKESSVVWGMPGAVATAGICSAVLPLNEIGPWVKKAAL